jgi:peptide/nickel transport system permease protein
MGIYIIKRLLFFIPTLIIVISILFVIKSSLPGDPVEDYLSSISETNADSEFYLTDYNKIATKMGLNKPPFYFSISPSHYPDNLYEIIPIAARNHKIKELKKQGFSWPSFKWHGSGNQFHVWFGSLFRGDLGLSIIDNKKVVNKIGKALKWSLLLMFISLFLSIALSIPLGLWLSAEGNRGIKSFVEKLSFFVYTIPLFWLCLLAVLYLTSGHYGFKLFPSIGFDPSIGRLDFWEAIGRYGNKLVLPAICWTLHTLVYIMMQFKSSINQERGLDYVTTAYAKGLSKKTATRKHVFKNALLPMITLFAGSIPGALAGSVVIETIFNIPGMGRLLINSIASVDWNVVMGISIIIAIVTMLSYLIADILYTYANPKIRFD